MVHNLHPQDDLLIVEALICLSHEFQEIDTQRSVLAWQLAEEISEEYGFGLEEAILQIEYNCPHPH